MSHTIEQRIEKLITGHDEALLGYSDATSTKNLRYVTIKAILKFVEEEKRKAVAEFAESLGLRHKYESTKE